MKTPIASVTIAPRGRCYQLAVRIGEQLARVHGQDITYRPHLTLQGIYDQANLDEVASVVRQLAATSKPFTVAVAGVGLLTSPSDPKMLFLHLNVVKSQQLVDLYAGVKQALEGLGLATYPFTPEQWVPHLTLASGRWSRSELDDLIRELEPGVPGCVLPVAELEVNRREQGGNWTLVERCPFDSRD
ncbi:MAG: 2'-5' RNA ligase family protein [Chloroflexota bacterium]